MQEQQTVWPPVVPTSTTVVPQVAPSGGISSKAKFWGVIGALTVAALIYGNASDSREAPAVASPTPIVNYEPEPVVSSSEDNFIAFLDSEGIHYSSEAAAIETGHATCRMIDRYGFGATSRLLLGSDIDYSSVELATIVGTSVMALCPEHEAEMTAWASS